MAEPQALTPFYRSLISTIRVFLRDNVDVISSLANVSACINSAFHKRSGLESVNWCGFYLLKMANVRTNSNELLNPADPRLLVVGPFQGLPATSMIRMGRGVCGTAIVQEKTQLVPNVHEHPNHIACDSRSQSEIVVPLFTRSGLLVGLLDIDALIVNFFTAEDQTGLEEICRILGQHCMWYEELSSVEVSEDKWNSMDSSEVLCPAASMSR